MSNEQNLDDILKLLKDSVSSNETDTDSQLYVAGDKEIDQADIEKQLKEHYLGGVASEEISSYEPVEEYVISDEFLAEIEKTENILDEEMGAAEEKDEKEPEAETVIADEEELVIEELYDENIISLVEEAFDEINSKGEVDSDFALRIEQFAKECGKHHEEPEVPEEIEEPEMDDISDVIENVEITELVEEEKENDELDDEGYDDIVFKNDEPEEMIILDNVIAEEDDTDKENTHHETFLASMRKTGVDFTVDDIIKADMQKMEEEKIEEPAEDDTDAAIEISEEDANSEELDISTINIMMQFCEKEELENTIGDTKVEKFLSFEQEQDVEHRISNEVLDGKEYVSDSQNQTIQDTYKKNISGAMWSAIGSGIVALLTIIFEMLPIAGTQLAGVLDYVHYPVIYMLLGLQFIVFIAAICYKKLWDGMKRAFSLRPNIHSVVAIILSLTALYDVITAIVLAFSGDDLPFMYNGVASIIAAAVMLADYLDIYSESRSFEIYSSSSQKYTLNKETQKTSVGAKLYGGGLESVKKVYSAGSVDFPKGFFRGFNATDEKISLLTMSIIPVMVIGMIATVVSVVMGINAYVSIGAFLICLYAILPIIYILSDSIGNTVATSRLVKNGSAYLGRNSVEKYSDCDVLVFRDVHLFKQIKTEDLGFAIYDNSVGYLALGCIDSLFRYIGGPLSGIKFDSVPEAYRFNNVQINRIARNGIDAVIEGRHSLLVGEYEFMKRYGLSFPEGKNENGRSTMCVSLNGKITAKISMKYTTEPIFEMLTERLYAEGVSVAVVTADPLISSKMIADNRKIGDAPISVIHKSVDEFGDARQSNYREDADGVIACQSRLKLAATVIWLKRLKKLKRINGIISIGFSAIALISVILLMARGALEYINQMHVLAYLLIQICAALGVTFAIIPRKDYFTVDKLYSELESAHTKEQKKLEVKMQKQKNKQAGEKNRNNEKNK